MAYKFVISKRADGDFQSFQVQCGDIFWTEGYTSKASAKNAIDSIQKNGPTAETVDNT